MSYTRAPSEATHPGYKKSETSSMMVSPRASEAERPSIVQSEISSLKGCSTAIEVRTQLNKVLTAMEVACADPKRTEEVVRCRPLLDGAAPENLTGKHSAWSRENRTFLMSIILHFFDGCGRLSMLPRELTAGTIFSFLGISMLAKMSCVSRGVMEIAESDAAWRAAYERRFSRDGAFKFDFGASLKESYRQRIRDPTVGDRIEVAWQGRFRLEGLEVYRGLAWWAAEVCEKAAGELPALPAAAPGASPARPRSASAALDALDVTQKRYKVHYLDWDARWDEWVSRDQLRWPVLEGKHCVIEPGDDVEVWCSGNTVPGAWLRAVIDRVDASASTDDDLYCVCNVASSGRLWVKRDRGSLRSYWARPEKPRRSIPEPEVDAGGRRRTVTGA
ncbi:hypothetical protein M885DRAFT_521389 [Pelagophyceae sp. CCMP2097]|nr:hypothetical protein M885DRAFT_521389 [Pelagophyceae sp. CCMP2097]